MPAVGGILNRMRPAHVSLAVIGWVIAQLISAVSATAEPRPPSILVFDESSVGGPFYPAIFSALRSTVVANSAHPVSVFLENLDLSRFRGPLYEERVKALFEAKYADKPIGVIVTVGSGALAHVLRFRAELWPDVPVVFAMVADSIAAQMKLPANVTGLTVKLRFSDMLSVARMVVPNLKRLAILGDPLSTQVVFRHFQEEIPAIAAGLEIIDLTGMPMRELRKRISALPDQTAIIYTSIYSDGEGTFYPPAEALTFVAEVANRPIVIPVETFMGRGGIGGLLLTPSAIGEEAAKLALRILDGDNASAIPIAEGHSTRPIFDWRQLQRWGVAGSRLPAGSEIRFHDPNAWEQYRGYVLAAGTAIVLQAALINWLLYERRRRRRSEEVARETMSELAHVNRVATAGELSASIAHEVTQPLTGMVSSANAALRWLSAATPDLDRARSALTQIVSAGHRTSEIVRSVRAMFKRDMEDRRPFDMNDLIWTVLMLVEVDLERHKIGVETRLDRSLPKICGDYVQIQQVLLNLTMNAIESMSGVGSRPRMLRIKSEYRGGNEVLVSVEDAGAGISRGDLDRIFKPLYTTKPRGMGMGLSICRSIIEAHHGRIWAAHGEQYGSIFQFALPVNRREN